jgi:predicted DNA-binding transcriptional regulator AlpA
MLSKTSSPSRSTAHGAPPTASVLLTPKQAARHLNLSVSWLAKRRLAGNGPPYFKLVGAVRYVEASLQQWMKSQQRTSTSGS